ncbi:electron transporter RnfC [Alkalispirochaeta sphaeroplastigenens]|uniref:Ion-translocating oxidoreductase complex subunit C n=1 Tax=Alkalispirochaeta sphaeroplastigenens TaxID=1187066 RepID=A0A2S4JND8_9SPIO|nr:electron transport complex subunit RsxC [Alkalispirochaeta sphaeroplastigenens]POR00990.1 electron transporter RnfC [Alkalispirochaeta sphaeroplastigenens]
MSRVKTFSVGGVHPPANKLTGHMAITELPPPATVMIPLSQHIGKPAEVVVERGAQVRVGTLLAKASGFISAAVHSSVSGKIKKIDTVIDAQGHRRDALVIAVEGDEWDEAVDTSPDLVEEISMDRGAIVSRISEAGIVGAGGATFPTAVKFSIPEGRTVDTLLINGVECEPYLTADHRMMLEQADELIVGIRLLMQASGAARTIIGIEVNKPDAIELLEKRIKEKAAAGKIPEGFVSVVALKEQYPQGGEKQLIEAATGREVPSGKLPLDVNCVVSNVGTAIAVYQAVQKNRPFIDRVVTVTGKELVAGGGGGNFRVRLGTPLRDLVAAAGGVPEGTGKIVMGGPMTGRAVTSLDVPVTKGSGGLIMLPAAEARRLAVCACIRCSRCVTACPMGLEPYLLEKLVQRDRFEAAEQEGIMDCIECGSCNFDCPSNRPILDWLRLGKGKVGELRRARVRGNQ